MVASIVMFVIRIACLAATVPLSILLRETLYTAYPDVWLFDVTNSWNGILFWFVMAAVATVAFTVFRFVLSSLSYRFFPDFAPWIVFGVVLIVNIATTVYIMLSCVSNATPGGFYDQPGIIPWLAVFAAMFSLSGIISKKTLSTD